MVSLGVRNVLVVLVAVLFAFYQLSKTWSRSRARKSNLESEFNKAVAMIEGRLDNDRYAIYRVSKDRGQFEDLEDVFRSTVIVVRRGGEEREGQSDSHLPTIVAEISHDRRRLTSRERREIAHTVKGKSRRKRKEAIKSKQFLRIEFFDPSLSYLAEPMRKAGIIRATRQDDDRGGGSGSESTLDTDTQETTRGEL